MDVHYSQKKIMRKKEVRRFMRGLRGIVRRLRRMVTRVSLSDWLALQARIRGFENPRLLRDRPSDGAALVCKNLGRVLRGDSYGGWSVMATEK